MRRGVLQCPAIVLTTHGECDVVSRWALRSGVCCPVPPAPFTVLKVWQTPLGSRLPPPKVRVFRLRWPAHDDDDRPAVELGARGDGRGVCAWTPRHQKLP